MLNRLRRLFSQQIAEEVAPSLEDDHAPASAREVFSDIYRRKAWFSPTADRELYSGPGSDPQFAQPYADAVRRFATERGVKTIVDLGCGDFRVGQRIAGAPFDYVGWTWWTPSSNTTS